MMMMNITAPKWMQRTGVALIGAGMAAATHIPSAMAQSAEAKVDSFVPRAEQLIANASVSVPKAVCVRSDKSVAGEGIPFLGETVDETNKNIEALVANCTKTLQADKKEGVGNGSGWLVRTKEGVKKYIEPTKANTLEVIGATSATTAAVVAAEAATQQKPPMTNKDISLLLPPKFDPPTITAKHNSKHPGRNLVQKPSQPSVKHDTTIKGKEDPTRPVDLNDKTSKDYTNAVSNNGLEVRVFKQPVAVCAVPSKFVKHRFAIERAIIIPKKLAGASTKTLLNLNNKDITDFYNDCIKKSNSVFGTTMKNVTSIDKQGNKVTGFATPRVLPYTRKQWEEFDRRNNLNLNTSVENGEKREF